MNRIVGIALVVLGLLALLGNLGYFEFDWDVLWRLWPAILIYAGVVRLVRYFGTGPR